MRQYQNQAPNTCTCAEKKSPCLKFPPQFCLAKWPAHGQPIGPDVTSLTQLSCLSFARPCRGVGSLSGLESGPQAGRIFTVKLRQRWQAKAGNKIRQTCGQLFSPPKMFRTVIIFDYLIWNIFCLHGSSLPLVVLSAFFCCWFNISFFLIPRSVIFAGISCSPGEPSLNTFVLSDAKNVYVSQLPRSIEIENERGNGNRVCKSDDPIKLTFVTVHGQFWIS